MPWRWHSLLRSTTLQATLTLMWTATALPLMVVANKRAIRPLWMVGAALLAVVVGKLFLVDLAALSGLSRVVAFLGVGVLPKVLVAFLISFFPLVIDAAVGLRSMSTEMRDLARSMGATRMQVFARVASIGKHFGVTIKADVPDAMPMIDTSQMPVMK